jgi:hypothetical protein
MRRVFWIVTPYSSERALPPASDGFVLRLLFNPEYVGDMLLRNDWLCRNFTALQPRTPYTSIRSVRHDCMIWVVKSEILHAIKIETIITTHRMACCCLFGREAVSVLGLPVLIEVSAPDKILKRWQQPTPRQELYDSQRR